MIRFIRKLNWAVRNHPALLSKIKTRRLRVKEVSPRAFLTFAEVENAFVFMERYSEIKDKLKREIVLLRGRGCVYAFTRSVLFATITLTALTTTGKILFSTSPFWTGLQASTARLKSSIAGRSSSWTSPPLTI